MVYSMCPMDHQGLYKSKTTINLSVSHLQPQILQRLRQKDCDVEVSLRNVVRPYVKIKFRRVKQQEQDREREIRVTSCEKTETYLNTEEGAPSQEMEAASTMYNHLRTWWGHLDTNHDTP